VRCCRGPCDPKLPGASAPDAFLCRAPDDPQGGSDVGRGPKQVRLCDPRMNGCRWPLRGRWEHVEFYCGEPTTPHSSWCAEHRKPAFARATSPAAGTQTKTPRLPARSSAGARSSRGATRGHATLVMYEIRKHRDDDAGDSEPPDDVDLFGHGQHGPFWSRDTTQHRPYHEFRVGVPRCRSPAANSTTEACDDPARCADSSISGRIGIGTTAVLASRASASSASADEWCSGAETRLLGRPASDLEL
jgi:hypothetical protein